ncbi:MAG: hypothetical protein J5930_01410 [Treponema sp.]|nr:hypothetical protein [Treponema sp.]
MIIKELDYNKYKGKKYQAEILSDWHGRRIFWRMKSYNKNEIYGIWKNQLALEFNCKAEDFDKEENIITLPITRGSSVTFSFAHRYILPSVSCDSC